MTTRKKRTLVSAPLTLALMLSLALPVGLGSFAISTSQAEARGGGGRAVPRSVRAPAPRIKTPRHRASGTLNGRKVFFYAALLSAAGNDREKQGGESISLGGRTSKNETSGSQGGAGVLPFILILAVGSLIAFVVRDTRA